MAPRIFHYRSTLILFSSRTYREWPGNCPAVPLIQLIRNKSPQQRTPHALHGYPRRHRHRRCPPTDDSAGVAYPSYCSLHSRTRPLSTGWDYYKSFHSPDTVPWAWPTEGRRPPWLQYATSSEDSITSSSEPRSGVTLSFCVRRRLTLLLLVLCPEHHHQQSAGTNIVVILTVSFLPISCYYCELTPLRSSTARLWYYPPPPATPPRPIGNSAWL